MSLKKIIIRLLKNSSEKIRPSNKLRISGISRKARLTFLFIIGAVTAAVAQIRTDKPQNKLTIMQVDAIESAAYTAGMSSSAKIDAQYLDALYAQNGLWVHKDMINDFIVRIKPIQTDLVEGDSDIADWNSAAQYVLNHTLDPRDGHIGYFKSDYRGRAFAPTVTGDRIATIGNVAPSEHNWMAHELFQHTHVWTQTTTFDKDALDSDHHQAIQFIKFIYTNSAGNSTTYENGYTNGTPAGGANGFRLPEISVSPQNAAANPAYGGNGFQTRTFSDNSKIEIPYLELDNASYEESADIIYSYYTASANSGLPGHDLRTQSLSALKTPVNSTVVDDQFSLNNTGDYDLFVRNTTNTGDNTHVTVRTPKLYLFEKDNQTNGAFVWSGDIDATVDLSDEGLYPLSLMFLKLVQNWETPSLLPDPI